MKTTLTTSDGRKLAYRTAGAGPVLVCHPGGPGLSASYLTDLGGIGQSFTLVLLDPRGTGSSDSPADPGAYRFDDYVGDIDVPGLGIARAAQAQAERVGGLPPVKPATRLHAAR